MQSLISDTYMDECSFKHLVESFSGDLLYYARSLVVSKEEAEEIVSDVFLEVWLRRKQVAEVRNLKGWLLTITHNKAVSYLRKQNSISVSLEESGVPAFHSDLRMPDEQLISREEMARVNCAIEHLPPRCREVFILAKIERLPYKDISNMLGISVKTINIHVAKALELISAELGL